MVTPTVCHDGKRHSWRYEATVGAGHGIRGNELNWCSKCGSLTEFSTVTSFVGGGERKERCRDEGRYYIEIPKAMKGGAE